MELAPFEHEKAAICSELLMFLHDWTQTPWDILAACTCDLILLVTEDTDEQGLHNLKLL